MAPRRLDTARQERDEWQTSHRCAMDALSCTANERDKAIAEMDALKDDLATNAAMLARQCDLVRATLKATLQQFRDYVAKMHTVCPFCHEDACTPDCKYLRMMALCLAEDQAKKL